MRSLEETVAMVRKALTFTEEEITAFHEEMLYPVVRIQAKSALGSGSIIYSKPKQDIPSEYETYILTNHHVIDSAITQVEKWSSLLQRKYKGDVFADVDVEIFEYQYESWEPTHHTIPGEIVTYDQDQDLGLVRLKTVKPMKYVARMLPKGESKNRLRMFMTTLTVGSGLGEEPFPSIPGMLANLNRRIANTDGKGYTFHLSSSPSIFGNCLVGDSLVSMSDNTVKPIKEIKEGDFVWSCSKGGVSSDNKVERFIESGEKDIYEVKTRTCLLRASDNHPVLKFSKRPAQYNHPPVDIWFKWAKVEDLADGDLIAVFDGQIGCSGKMQKQELNIEGFDNKNIPTGLHLEKVEKMKVVGKEKTYDIKLDHPHNFFADGVLVHNSGGACFLTDTHEMIGIPSRIAVTGRLGSDAITHMGYIIPIERVYRFFKAELLYFLYDSNYTSDQCFDLRKKKREEDEKRMAIDISRNGEVDTSNNS